MMALIALLLMWTVRARLTKFGQPPAVSPRAPWPVARRGYMYMYVVSSLFGRAVVPTCITIALAHDQAPSSDLRVVALNYTLGTKGYSYLS